MYRSSSSARRKGYRRGFDNRPLRRQSRRRRSADRARDVGRSELRARRLPDVRARRNRRQTRKQKMSKPDSVKKFWEAFCAANPEKVDPAAPYEVWFFHHNRDGSIRMVELVLSGKKR